MKIFEKLKLRLICGGLSFFIGCYLAYIAVRAFFYRETFFTADAEFPITQAYFYQVLGVSSLVAFLLIAIPTILYFKNKK